jgi:hypothetical protein
LALALSLLDLFLLPNGLPHPDFIQPHRTYTVPRCPEMQPRHPALLPQLPMNAHGTLPFPLSPRVRHAVFGGNTQAQRHMVGHAMPFQQVNPFPPTQLPQDRPNLPP